MPTLFDRKFGLSSGDIPDRPGVYFFEDENHVPIYVGKAKSLRRRLGQYRRLSRKKKDRKRSRIVRSAHHLRWDIHPTPAQAALKELEWIQRLRPKLNVEGAFFFLYPYLGVHWKEGDLSLCYSQDPQGAYTYFGAYRSRQVTREAFDALAELFEVLFHPLERPRLRAISAAPYTRRAGWRRVPEAWVARLHDFFLGNNRELLTELTEALLDKPAARSRGADIQVALRTVDRFRRWEVVGLRQAIDVSGFPGYPVPQLERDRLFLKVRNEVVGEMECPGEVTGGEPSI